MNKRYSIGDLMSIYYEREFSAVEEVVLPDFTVKHNKIMRKAFNAFAINTKRLDSKFSVIEVKNNLSIRKRVIFAAIIIVCLALATGCIIAFVSNSFRGTVYNDNTHLFVFDANGSPSVIEDIYELSIVPTGYELCETTVSDVDVFTIYQNSFGQELIFVQSVKDFFNPHINTENYTIEELTIVGCHAICVEYERDLGVSSLVIWDNNEYILELHGDLTKIELIKLANSNENIGF